VSERYRVVRSYESPYTEPLTLPKGERLRWEPRECEWPGWIWCTTESGLPVGIGTALSLSWHC